MFASPSREQKVADIENNGVLLVSKVFVGGLAEQTQEEDLRTLFADIAPTKSIQIISDRSRNEVRRYAFIEFETQEEVKKVIGQFRTNPVELHGRKLIIHQAYKRHPNSARKMFPSVLFPWNYCLPQYYAAAAMQMQNMAMAPSSPYMMLPSPMPSQSFDYRNNMNAHTNGMVASMAPLQGLGPSSLTYTPPMSPYNVGNVRNNGMSANLDQLANELYNVGLGQESGMNGLGVENLYKETAVNGHMGPGSWKTVPEMPSYNEPARLNGMTFPRGSPAGYYM